MSKDARQGDSKFVLYSLSGKPVAWYEVKAAKDLTGPASGKKASIGHTIIVVDRSGSMCGDIDQLKDTLVKLLTIQEYADAKMLVSLISYSSCGDCTLHFDRAPVGDIMKSGSSQQKQIRSIKSWGLTCISQAMNMAKGLIRDGEVTGIVLHSDGYANDPGVWHEQKQVQAVCDSLKCKNVFVNTVAYRGSSDFAFLSAIANAASGKCLRAGTVKEVFDALQDTSASVVKASPAVAVALEGADYVIAMSKSQKKVNGSARDLTVAGAPDDLVVFRYSKVSEDAYRRSPAAEDQHSPAVLAFAKANLAEGRLNVAKYATYSSCCQMLAERNVKALTASQLADFSSDLDRYLFESASEDRPDTPDPLARRTTVVALAGVLEAHSNEILVGLADLNRVYKRRTVKRIPGVRKDDGTVEEPWLDTEYIDDGEWVQMGSFDVSRDSATMNLLLTRPTRLVKKADRKPITQVAGVNVTSLPSFRNYTVVGDGDVVLPRLKVKFGTKAAYEAVRDLGVLSGDDGQFDFRKECEIRLDDLPVCSYEFSGAAAGLKEAFRQILGLKTVASILSAATKDDSDKFTPEQVEELKKHYLSKNLYINFPTTTEYADLQQAINEGKVDTRVAYKVEIGDAEILNAGRLLSANAFLERHYVVPGTAKPKIPDAIAKSGSVQHKLLGPKVKVTAVDNFCRPIFDEMVMGEGDAATKLLASAGCPTNFSPMELHSMSVPGMIQSLKVVESVLEKIYREKIVPLAFYVGATGLLPDSMGTKAETADEIEARLPNLSLKKDEKDGSFFQVGDVIISVYPTQEHFSTGS